KAGDRSDATDSKILPTPALALVGYHGGRWLVGSQASSRDDDVRGLRKNEVLELRRVWKGHVVRGHAQHGRVEPLEAALIDARGDLAGNSARARILMQDEHAVGLSDGREDGVVVEWAQRAQVDDFDRQSVLFLELRGRLQRFPHGGRVRDDG